jgi:IclR family acetate operon transcriptional repressor
LKSTFGPGPYQGYTPTTITTLKNLARECARIKAEGFAMDEEEYVEGVRCLAAPVRDRDGVVIASIGISAPLARLPREREAAAARQVCEAAAEIRAVLSAESAE